MRAITEIAAELTAAVPTPATWKHILAALRGRRLRGKLADATLRCLPFDEMDLLARHLLHSRADLALPQSTTSADPWLRQRLPPLIRWREPDTPVLSSGPTSTADLPGAKASPSHRITLGLTLNGYARAATPARRMACILATARNEGAYLTEWIAHHRAIGFEHIFYIPTTPPTARMIFCNCWPMQESSAGFATRCSRVPCRNIAPMGMHFQ